jgi:hypothetical protein
MVLLMAHRPPQCEPGTGHRQEGNRSAAERGLEWEADLIERAEEISIGGAPIRVPATGDLILLTAWRDLLASIDR